MSDDIDGVRGSGPDGNKTEDKTKIEVLVKIENGDVQSESHSNCMVLAEIKWRRLYGTVWFFLSYGVFGWREIAEFFRTKK